MPVRSRWPVALLLLDQNRCPDRYSSVGLPWIRAGFSRKYYRRSGGRTVSFRQGSGIRKWIVRHRAHVTAATGMRGPRRGVATAPGAGSASSGERHGTNPSANTRPGDADLLRQAQRQDRGQRMGAEATTFTKKEPCS
jgi:hypothetical protein